MARQMIKVRIANAYSLYKEEGEGAADDGRPFDIHITGFDNEGHPVRPVVEVPRTNRVMKAITEGRLQDVEREEGGLEKAQADVARLKDLHNNAQVANPVGYGSASDEDNKRALQEMGVVGGKTEPKDDAKK